MYSEILALAYTCDILYAEGLRIEINDQTRYLLFVAQHTACRCLMPDINAFGYMFSKVFFCLFAGITVTLATAAPQILRPLVPSAEGIAAILMQVLVARIHKLDAALVARIHKLDLEPSDPSRKEFLQGLLQGIKILVHLGCCHTAPCSSSLCLPPCLPICCNTDSTYKHEWHAYLIPGECVRLAHVATQSRLCLHTCSSSFCSKSFDFQVVMELYTCSKLGQAVVLGSAHCMHACL